MIFVSKNVCIDILDDKVNKYNKTLSLIILMGKKLLELFMKKNSKIQIKNNLDLEKHSRKKVISWMERIQ